MGADAVKPLTVLKATVTEGSYLTDWGSLFLRGGLLNDSRECMQLIVNRLPIHHPR